MDQSNPNQAQAINAYINAKYQTASASPGERFLIDSFAPLEFQPGIGATSKFEKGVMAILGIVASRGSTSTVQSSSTVRPGASKVAVWEYTGRTSVHQALWN